MLLWTQILESIIFQISYISFAHHLPTGNMFQDARSMAEVTSIPSLIYKMLFSFFIYFLFYCFCCSFIHMCIHCLGNFSTLPPPPPFYTHITVMKFNLKILHGDYYGLNMKCLP
jgi:hypothetical protein